MSGLIGKKNSTLKKESVKESNLLTTGVRALRFWHEASEGDSSIPFGSLNLPADILAIGLANPDSTAIMSAHLELFSNNVTVVSSLNQVLMEGLSYIVKNNQITLVNYTALEGEIFEVTFKNEVITGKNIVDARPLTATGVLAIGQTEFNVGESFKVNENPATQLGSVLVFKDGILQFRNVGNATAAPSADGNYQEIHSTNGSGVVIKFNDVATAERNIVVTSRGLIAERPEISTLQIIENLGGQLDKVIETTAALAGVPESDFQTAPNNVDLKSFGDKVIDNESTISKILEVEVTSVTSQSSIHNAGGNTLESRDQPKLNLSNVSTIGSGIYTIANAATRTEFTFLEDAEIDFAWAATFGITCGIEVLRDAGGAERFTGSNSANSVGNRSIATASFKVFAGDKVYMTLGSQDIANDGEIVSIVVLATRYAKTKIKDLI